MTQQNNVERILARFFQKSTLMHMFIIIIIMIFMTDAMYYDENINKMKTQIEIAKKKTNKRKTNQLVDLYTSHYHHHHRQIYK